MKWPWENQESEAPAVRPKYKTPITEFEAKRLEQTGQWLTIQIQVTPNGQWTNWKHNIPPELKKEAKEALVSLALQLQDQE